MNAYKLIGLLTLIVLFSGCSQQSEDSSNAEDMQGWETFTENNYSIRYPNTWELDISKQMGSSFMLFSPLTSEEDLFKENVNLIIQDLKGLNLNLDEYVKISEDQVKSAIVDGDIIESKRKTSENLDYHKLICVAKQGIYDLTFEQFFWVIDEQAYVLTLTCEEDQFDDYKVTGENILKSFKFND